MSTLRSSLGIFAALGALAMAETVPMIPGVDDAPSAPNSTKHRAKGKSYGSNGARETERRRKRIAAGKLKASDL